MKLAIILLLICVGMALYTFFSVITLPLSALTLLDVIAPYFWYKCSLWTLYGIFKHLKWIK